MSSSVSATVALARSASWVLLMPAVAMTCMSLSVTSFALKVAAQSLNKVADLVDQNSSNADEGCDSACAEAVPSDRANKKGKVAFVQPECNDGGAANELHTNSNDLLEAIRRPTPTDIALMRAVFRNSDDAIRIIREGIADVNCYTVDQDRCSLLHWAVRKGNLDLVNELLAAGADVNWANRLGHTPLHFASQKSNLEITTRLVEAGATVNALSDMGCSPLFFACCFGSLETVQFLINLGGLINHPSVQRSTPLMAAVSRNRDDVARVLLANNACPNYQNLEGLTPMHVAAERKNIDLLKVMISLGGDPAIRDKRNRSVLDIVDDISALKSQKSPVCSVGTCGTVATSASPKTSGMSSSSEVVSGDASPYNYRSC